jgi:hypothetical protein
MLNNVLIEQAQLNIKEQPTIPFEQCNWNTTSRECDIVYGAL